MSTVDWSPQPYQERALSKMMEQGPVGLLADPGLGKTATCLAAFDILRDVGQIQKMLIICPLRVAYNVWPYEIAKWTQFAHLDYAILHGPHKGSISFEDHDVFILPVTSMKWFHEQGLWYQFDNQILCVDESTLFKNYSSKRFKNMLKPNVSRFQRRWILTGTPTPNGLKQFWSQMYILDAGHTLGRFITHFRRKWMHEAGWGGYDWEFNHGAVDEILDKIKPYVIRLTKEDNLEMPPIQYVTRSVNLPPEVRRIYDEVEEEGLAELNENTSIVSLSAAASGIKMRQIAGGACYTEVTDEDGVPTPPRRGEVRDWEELHDAKIRDLEGLLEELQGAPLLLFYEFDHERQRIEKLLCQLDLTFSCLTGLGMEETSAVIDKFNAGRYSVLMTHPAAAGHGLNLQQACRHVCWFTRTWDLELFTQGNDRVHRQGQEDQVMVYMITVRDSIEEKVAASVESKTEFQKYVDESLK